MSDNNIKKLLTALGGSVQDLEDVLQTLLLGYGVDTAVGEQLNVLGRLVGQGRGGLDDASFRRLVRARISTNRSKGTIADVIKVTTLIVSDPTATMVVDNWGTAGYVLRVEDAAVANVVAALLLPMLREATAGGVRVILEWSPQIPANWLILDTDTLDNKLMIAAV